MLVSGEEFTDDRSCAPELSMPYHTYPVAVLACPGMPWRCRLNSFLALRHSVEAKEVGGRNDEGDESGAHSAQASTPNLVLAAGTPELFVILVTAPGSLQLIKMLVGHTWQRRKIIRLLHPLFTCCPTANNISGGFSTVPLSRPLLCTVQLQGTSDKETFFSLKTLT